YKDGIYTNVTIAVSEADNGKVESFVMLGKDRALVTAHGVLVGQKIDSGIDTDKVLTAIALNKSDYC
ncbi:MAG: hypothetical protein J6U50_06465, partial [Lachnospiraceae bacterium]|nr:hypothetical protein [Lachnospiraceae bacterium]